MTGATIGKVKMFEQEEKAILNQRNGVIRSDEINTYYLMNLLNTSIYQKLILKNSVGGAQPNISETAITNLKVPLPPIAKQNEIAAHIANIRAQAKQLQTEAEQILATAKAEIERMILGKA
jgi:restriction endonuclease S subunit